MAWLAAAVALLALAGGGVVFWLLNREPSGTSGTQDTPKEEASAKKVPPRAKKKPAPPVQKDLDRVIVNSIGMKLVLVPAGKFLMGSPRSEPSHRDAEWPHHEVEITQPFYMGAHEVTQAQYEKVMGTNPSRYQKGNAGGPDHPVECVSWANAVAFCRKLTALPEERARNRRYQLPTEAQWEYACRGGPAATTDPFHYGKSLSSRQANINGNFPYASGELGPYKGRTEKAGSYRPNALGLYDMHGNVWEWCLDWYDPNYYKVSPKKDPPGPDSSPAKCHALRSGSWNDPGLTCRAAYRNPVAPPLHEGLIGFRVICLAGSTAGKSR